MGQDDVFQMQFCQMFFWTDKLSTNQHLSIVGKSENKLIAINDNYLVKK